MRQHLLPVRSSKISLCCALALLTLFAKENPIAKAQSPVPPALKIDTTGFYWPTGTKMTPPYNWLADSCTNWSGNNNYLRDSNGSGEYHIGVDIAAKLNYPIYAIADGTVILISSSGWQVMSEGPDNRGILVRHELADKSEFIALYGHVVPSVQVGDTVLAGKQFASVGHWLYGDHLHFGILPSTKYPPDPNHLGMMPCPDKKPPNGLDPNGFVEPIEWITSRQAGASPASPSGIRTIPSFNGTIVDNKSSNFTPSGTSNFWKESNGGVNGSFLSTKNNKSKVDNAGTWKLPIPQASDYDVFVFIPSDHSTSTHATYEIGHSGKTDLYTISQLSHHNEWLKVGTFHFDAKGPEFIRLTDSTGETDQSTEIAFDAVGFNIHELSPIEKLLDETMRRINDWIDAQQKAIQERLGQWAREETDKLTRDLGNWIVKLLRQSCASSALVFLFPAYVLWTTKHKKSER